MNNIIITKKMDEILGIEIRKSEKWKWSIEIKFDIKEETNYFDLFLILKSFAWNKIVPCHSIAFGKKKTDNTLIICERESILRVKKIRFSEFKEWINWRISNDRKYSVNSSFCYVLISFEKKICEEKGLDLNHLKPALPWKEDWISFLNIDEDRIEYLENLIKDYEKRIKKMEEEGGVIKKKEGKDGNSA